MPKKKIRKNRIVNRFIAWLEKKAAKSDLWHTVITTSIVAIGLLAFTSILYNIHHGLVKEMFIPALVVTEFLFILNSIGAGKFDIWDVIGGKIGIGMLVLAPISIGVAAYRFLPMHPEIVIMVFKALGTIVIAIAVTTAFIWLNMKVANKVGGMK